MPNIDKIRVNNVDYDINKDIYSTAEQEIGTWIDESPLYRKTITLITTTNAGSWTDYSVNISNLNRIVKIEGVIQRGVFGSTIVGFTNFLPFKEDDNTYIDISYTMTNNNTDKITYRVGSNMINLPLTIHIYYTKKELPSEYKRLEYIQSSGTQYINTGFKPTENNLMIDSTLMITESKSQTLYGSQKSGSDRFSITPYSSSNNNQYAFWVFDSDNLSSTTISVNSKHNFSTIARNGKLYVNLDGSKSNANISGNVNSSLNMYIFANNMNDTAAQLSSMKLYSFKIIHNDIVVRNYIPAQRKSDSAIGLYDAVNKEFYTNAGTGTFTAGPEV